MGSEVSIDDGTGRHPNGEQFPQEGVL